VLVIMGSAALCNLCHGLVRHHLCRNAYGRCVRTSSVIAPHHQAESPRGHIMKSFNLQNTLCAARLLLGFFQLAHNL
jgi:hypothetical protein